MVVGEQVICRGIMNAWEKNLDMLKADRVLGALCCHNNGT